MTGLDERNEDGLRNLLLLDSNGVAFVEGEMLSIDWPILIQSCGLNVARCAQSESRYDRVDSRTFTTQRTGVGYVLRYFRDASE